MQAFYFDAVDSTNEVARRLLREGRIGDFAYIVAREQSAGRGNRGHTWLSPADAGIYLTVVYRPVQTGGDLHLFTRAAGVACVETLLEWTGVTVRLRPINDLYVNGRKLGGILTEAVIDGGRASALIIGVGVNLRRAERPLPADHVRPVCLEELMPDDAFAALDARRLTVALAQKIKHRIANVSCEDGRKMEEESRKYSATVDACGLESTQQAPSDRD